MTTPRYPISDKDMLELLNKYPFLRYRDMVADKPIYYGKSKDLEYNYYKYWDGNGWEYLWKYKYLPRLFKEYDSWTESDKNHFRFLQVKEKYGSLRIYCSGYSNKNLESIAESLSSYTCEYCGTEYDATLSQCPLCGKENEAPEEESPAASQKGNGRALARVRKGVPSA